MSDQRRSLGATGVVTSALGLGCATLFHLSRPAERRAVLDMAFFHGITHFDVAPMYGLGLAELELGSFLQGRRDGVTVTTKFGINTTPFGRAAGRMQGPARAVLQRLPRVSRGLKSSGRSTGSGLGRLMYTSEPYSPETVRRSLDRSLALLQTDYVDVFLVHDPTNALLSSSGELADHLSSEVAKGRIRTWGSAADVNLPTGEVRYFAESSPVLQFRDNIFERHAVAASELNKGIITFGVMEGALPSLRRYFDRSDSERATWSARLGFDVLGPEALAHLLLRQAIYRNQTGPVLFSSTRIDRVRGAAALAEGDPSAMRDEALAVDELTVTIRRAEEGAATL